MGPVLDPCSSAFRCPDTYFLRALLEEIASAQRASQ